MHRRRFITQAGVLSAGIMLNKTTWAAAPDQFPVVRVAPGNRKFTSTAVEEAISKFKQGVGDKELGWLFENCFPNTLDTTVFFELVNGVPDTYVITGDIDAMWLRDSSAQV